MALKKIKIELDYDHGDEVYLKTDPEALKRIVVEITLLPGPTARYLLSCGGQEPSYHYAVEMTETKPVP